MSQRWKASLLTGQAFATMLDLQAVPETLDFAGPNAAFSRRQPLLRITKTFRELWRVEIAAETPENVEYIDASRRTRWPDFVMAHTWQVSTRYLDHIRVAGLVRDLRAHGETGSTQSTTGWALAGSGKLLLPFLGERDNLRFNVAYGYGYGAQLESGPADAAFDPATSRLESIELLSTYAGLQHFWTDELRSNLVGGYVDADNPGFVAGDEPDNSTYVAVDLVWTPWPPTTLGIEYLWGRRENIDGDSGTDSRILFSSTLEF